MAMVPHNWSINIAKHEGVAWNNQALYLHFATVELGQMLEEKAGEKFNVFQEKFQWPEYKVTMSEVTCFGKEVLSNDPDA